MKLIGMLDSPYVRRVAISFQLLDIPFEHQSLSVFRTFDQFSKINPVVKAPTLVCDDGEVLMDSTLILEYGEAIASNGRSLMPRGRAERQHALHTIGLARWRPPRNRCRSSMSTIRARRRSGMSPGSRG